MQKFTVTIDMTMEQIIKGYQHYFDTTEKPTRKDIASWIGSLAQADILDCASHDDDQDDED